MIAAARTSNGIDLLIIIAVVAFMFVGGHYLEWRHEDRDRRRDRKAQLEQEAAEGWWLSCD